MMAEWHITPDYIMDNWTDELLNLMVVKLVERKKGVEPKPSDSGLSRMGKMVKVVKK